MDEQEKQPKADFKQASHLHLSAAETAAAAADAQHSESEQATSASKLFDGLDDYVDDRADQLARAQGLVDERKVIGGRYTILELIGMGAVGSVYKVKHELLGKTFALKMLNPNVSAEFKVIQRFHREAKAVAELSHPNLISVHDFGVTESGSPYLVMDYLEGTSLDKEIEKAGHLDEHRVIAMFQKVCEGLSYAHAKGIIHRDLKPSNIMLVKDEQGNEIPKIVDFGIAKKQAVDSKLTQTGEVFGTPLYMSPEQCLGSEVDARSDIYSLGCIMYECLSGQAAFAAANIIQTIFRHVNEDAKPLRKACQGFEVSSAIEQVVTSCLERERSQRPATADGLALNLERLAQGKTPINVRKLPKIKRKQVRGAFVVSMAALLGMLLMLGIWLIILMQQPPYLDTIRAADYEDAHGNYKRALELAQKAVAQADEKGAPAKDRLQLHRFVAAYAAKLNNAQLVAGADMESARLATLVGDKGQAAQFALNGAKYADWSDAGNAQQYYKQAVEATSKAFGSDSPQLVAVLLDAASSAHRRNTDGDMKVCLSYLEQARQVADHHHDLSAGTRFKLYHELGQTYGYFKRFADADKAIGEAESAARDAQVDTVTLNDLKKWRQQTQEKLKVQQPNQPTDR